MAVGLLLFTILFGMEEEPSWLFSSHTPEKTYSAVGISGRFTDREKSVNAAIEDGLFWLSLQFTAAVDWRNAETTDIYGIINRDFIAVLPDEKVLNRLKSNYTLIDSFLTIHDTYVLLAVKDDFGLISSEFINQIKDSPCNLEFSALVSDPKSKVYISKCGRLSRIGLNEHCSYENILIDIASEKHFTTKSLISDQTRERFNSSKTIREFQTQSIVQNARITDRYYDKKSKSYYLRVLHNE